MTGKYKIIAECNSPKCKGRVFNVYRDKIIKKSKSGSGRTYLIENIVCPECRMWAKVKEIA